MLLPAECENHKLNLFLDTGSPVNLISFSKFKEINNQYKESYPDINIKSISDDQVETLSKVYLPIKITQESATPLPFYVVTKLPISTDILLGSESMRSLRIIIFTHMDQVMIGGLEGETIECTRLFNTAVKGTSRHPKLKRTSYHSGTMPRKQFNSRTTPNSLDLPITTTPSTSTPSYQYTEIAIGDLITKHSLTADVILSTDVIIQPKSSKKVETHVNELPPNYYKYSIITLPDTSNIKGLITTPALHESKTKSFETMVINYSDNVLKLKKGTKIMEAEVFPFIFNDQSLPVTSKNFVINAAISKDDSDTLTLIKSMISTVDFENYSENLLNLLCTYKEAVMLNNEDLGFCDVITHKIILRNSETNPIYCPSYRLAHAQREQVDKQVKTMLDQQIVSPSSSRYRSPIFLVPKRNPNEWRLVVDFRKLNEAIVDEKFYMPSIAEVMSNLNSKNKIFSTIDLGSGFHQINLDEESRKFTAFSTPSGTYEFNRLPQGLKTSPGFFQRLMCHILAGHLGKDIQIYIDDIIIMSPDIDSHLKSLEKILQKLKEAGLKIKLSKCKFLKKSVEFLGHELSAEGIRTKTDITKAITDFPQPKDVTQLRQFLGLAGYYRSFISNFSEKASPLFKLLKKDAIFDWQTPEQESFDKLKLHLSSPPCLSYPDYTQPFVIHTDASYTGIGACLMQKDCRGKLQPLGFASRTLKPAEKNYSVTDIEGAGLIWALQTFKDKILNYDIEVWTDHKPLLNLFEDNNLSGRRARWKFILQSFNPRILYIKGHKNVVADSLSRNPLLVAHLNTMTLANEDMSTAQRGDPKLCEIILALENNVDNPDLEEYTLIDNSLFRKHQIEGKHQMERDILQLVIPDNKVKEILPHIHGSKFVGHPGKERAMLIANKQFFWKTMKSDIANHIDTCENCARINPRLSPPTNISTYPVPDKPFQLIAIDLLKLPKTNSGMNYLMVASDHFSRYSILSPIQDKEAVTIVKTLVRDVICKYPTPNTILSDNGREFVNETMSKMCDEYGIQHNTVAPYSPQSNGLVERANRKILQELKNICLDRDHEIWDEFIPFVECTLNSLPNISIGESPHFIVFGEDKHLPNMLSHQLKPIYTQDFITHHNNTFKRIHKQVRDKLTLTKEKMVKYNHKSNRQQKFKPGDIVFSRIHDRSDKLDPLFEGPYRIISIHHNIALIKHLEKSKESRSNVNHLKLVNRNLDCVQSGLDNETNTPVKQTPSKNETPTHNYNLRSRNVNNILISNTAVTELLSQNNITPNIFYT